MNALVLPRPIGWISAVSAAGSANLAPYSLFNAVAYLPPQVIFVATGAHDHGGLKDSVANIEATKEFVVNLATWALREAVNASSIGAPHGFDEFAHAGLTKIPSVMVEPPRVAESPVHLECVLSQIVELEPPPPEAQPHGHRPRHRHPHRRRDDRRRPWSTSTARSDRAPRLRPVRPRPRAFAMTRPRWDGAS